MNTSGQRPILIVDDNSLDVELALRALKMRNKQLPVEIARDGEEALSFIPRWDAGEAPPAVILLDVNMPRINGHEVLQELKTHPIYRRIPVVMLTTSDEQRDLEDAYSRGANSYVVKPVDFDRFLDVASQIESYWIGVNAQTA
jgi:CheY-like chemotaxis protein